jgi:hypothetical protein
MSPMQIGLVDDVGVGRRACALRGRWCSPTSRASSGSISPGSSCAAPGQAASYTQRRSRVDPPVDYFRCTSAGTNRAGVPRGLWRSRWIHSPGCAPFCAIRCPLRAQVEDAGPCRLPPVQTIEDARAVSGPVLPGLNWPSRAARGGVAAVGGSVRGPPTWAADSCWRWPARRYRSRPLRAHAGRFLGFDAAGLPEPRQSGTCRSTASPWATCRDTRPRRKRFGLAQQARRDFDYLAAHLRERAAANRSGAEKGSGTCRGELEKAPGP